MKKVLFFIPTLSLGGGERVVSELSRHLPPEIERKIILLKREVSYPYKGEVISLDIKLGQHFFSKVYNYWLALQKFRQLIKKEKPDYVISFGHICNIINIMSGAKAIVRADNFFSRSLPGFGGFMYKVFIKALFNKAYMIVAVSKESSLDLQKNFNVQADKVKVMYNPINVSQIEALTQEELENEYKGIFENPVIITMGRLNLQKGQKLLIESFLKVKEKIKSAKLVILGKGELEEDLKRVAKSLNLQHDVYFLGWQKNPFKFLARAKVFALSSLWEGLPYVLLEAMACSLPIVSFDCKSGPREILAPGTNVSKQSEGVEHGKYGFLVKPEDSGDLASALLKMLSHDSIIKEYKKRSRDRAMDFDIHNIIKEWEFLIRP